MKRSRGRRRARGSEAGGHMAEKIRPVLWRRLALIIALCTAVALAALVIRGLQLQPRHGAPHTATQ